MTRFNDWLIGREMRQNGLKYGIFKEFYLFYRICILENYYGNSKAEKTS